MEDNGISVLSEDDHLALIGERADAFLAALAAASEAGVSQALVLPLLIERLRESGVVLDPRALMGALG